MFVEVVALDVIFLHVPGLAAAELELGEMLNAGFTRPFGKFCDASMYLEKNWVSLRINVWIQAELRKRVVLLE
eukprot:1159469-Pelagomonas_calceolata.AAC.7